MLNNKMYFVEKTEFWMCKDCSWKGRAKHKAKAHARDCCSRRKTKRTSSEKQFACSNNDCDCVFSSKKQLKEHYRYQTLVLFYVIHSIHSILYCILPLLSVSFHVSLYFATSYYILPLLSVICNFSLYFAIHMPETE